MNSMQSKNLPLDHGRCCGRHPRRLFERRRADGGQSRHAAHLRSPTTPARPRPTPTCRPSASTCGRTSRLTTVAAGCHNAGGQTPQFARNDDVNLAYQAANTVVNLTMPDQSRMVTKVAGGHNCWLQSAAACGDTLTVWIRNWAGASATGGTQIQLQAPAIREVGGSKSFPADHGVSSPAQPCIDWYATPPRPIACAAILRIRPRSSSRSSPKAPPRRPCRRSWPSIPPTPPSSRRSISTILRLHAWSCACATSSTTAGATRVAGPTRTRCWRRSLNSPTISTSPSSIRQLLISKGLTLYDGTVAAGGNRYEAATIAKYEFKTGMGNIAYDTSGRRTGAEPHDVG